MDHNTFLNKFKSKNIRVIAVSKTKTADQILQVYKSGHRDFGENKVQELVSKNEILPKDIKWHMIGHLQKNKVKYIAPFVHLIHSVDSLDLLEVINKEAKKNDRTQNILVQVRIAQEETKFGIEPKHLNDIMDAYVANKFPNVKICGLMGMASFTDDTQQIDKEFELLHDIFIEVKQVFLDRAYYFKELSIGMSGDYEIAIEHGASMIRIGTLIFGQRY